MSSPLLTAERQFAFTVIDNQTGRDETRWRYLARIYQRLSAAMKPSDMAEHSRNLLAGLTGRVIEVVAGKRLNFALYPDQVSMVLAVEPEPYLRHAATRAAASTRADASR